MITFIQSWGSLIISGLSLVVAVISYAKASESQQLQNRVNILELKIKHNHLDFCTYEFEEYIGLLPLISSNP